MEHSDDALIARHRQGDAAAFEALYRRYAARLLGFVTSLGAPRDAAEDLAQRCWLKLLGALERYEPQGRFRAYLFTLAHRLWLDGVRSAWERRRVALDPAELETPGGGPDPREAAAAREERARVDGALAELPEELRRTVLLRVDGELTYREIAEVMDCPLGTALWRMSEAQRRLSELLNPPEKDARNERREKIAPRGAG